MSKFHAPSPASKLPAPHQKRRGKTKLSFEDLVSIDFIGLVEQAAPVILPPEACGLQEPGTSQAGSSSSPELPIGGASDQVNFGDLAPGGKDLTSWTCEPPFYSIGDAAAWLGVSLATMKRLLRKGAIPFVKVGARRKIPLSALRAYAICTHAGCVIAPLTTPNNSMSSGG